MLPGRSVIASKPSSNPPRTVRLPMRCAARTQAQVGDRSWSPQVRRRSLVARAYSSGGQSAPLIRARSVVRVYLCPPWTSRPGCVASPLAAVAGGRDRLHLDKRRGTGRESARAEEGLRGWALARRRWRAGATAAGCREAQPCPEGSGGRSREQGRTVDALVPWADEGRGKLRKSSGSRTQALIRGRPNGGTRRDGVPSPAAEHIGGQEAQRGN